MKLLHMLRPAVGGPPGRQGLERLKAAIAARDDAKQVAIAASETLERLQGIVGAADEAARAASSATRAANEARQRWVREGCTFSGGRELEVLDAAAAEKTRAAEGATVNADAVRKELARAEDAVKSARRNVEEHEDKIRYEIDLILVSEFDGEFDLGRGERLAAELQAWRIQVRGLYDLVGGAEAQRLLEAALQRARAPLREISGYECSAAGSHVSSPPTEVLLLTKAWRARAAQLRADAE
jgi:hypothetical protein